MNLERVASYHAYEVEISWKRPIDYDAIIAHGSRHDPDGWLYMILGYHRSPHPKIFYIGQVQQTIVSRRLRAPDHRARYLRLCHDHPHHSFRVSLGAVTVSGGRITGRLIDHIEHILIYATYNSKSHAVHREPNMINKRYGTSPDGHTPTSFGTSSIEHLFRKKSIREFSFDEPTSPPE